MRYCEEHDSERGGQEGVEEDLLRAVEVCGLVDVGEDADGVFGHVDDDVGLAAVLHY